MTLEQAPLFEDIAPGPAGGAAYWLHAEDRVRIRIALWAPDAPKGTVLLFPGRTEYIEKYGVCAQELATRGYATLAVDWRGQGLADRLLQDARIGHVARFTDYQQDVAAVLAAVQKLGVVTPLYLLGHSMGGCIGLRALTDGAPVAAAAFSGPMWGIRIAAPLRPIAWGVGNLMSQLGRAEDLLPGRSMDSYVLSAPFADNTLTTDRDNWDMMVAQLKAHPELELGGPSAGWLSEALAETMALSRLPAPDLPCRTFLGTNERIVQVDRIQRQMARWPNGELILIENGEHEVMMEGPAVRAKIFDSMAETFASAG